MSNEDISAIWSEVSERHRHIARTEAVVKNEEFIKGSISDLGIQIDNPRIIDWGPGGGWLSKALNPEHVTFIDIVEDYDKAISCNFSETNCDLKFNNLVGDDFKRINFSGNYDYGIMYSVIYHMPSTDYAVSAIKTMMSARPKYILIRNVFTDKKSWERSLEKERYSSDNYIRGNILGIEHFKAVAEESGYEILYFKKDKDLSRSRYAADRENSSYSAVVVLEMK